MAIFSKATVAGLFLVLASGVAGQLQNLASDPKQLSALDFSKAQDAASMSNAMDPGSLMKAGIPATSSTLPLGKRRLNSPRKDRSPSLIRRDDAEDPDVEDLADLSPDPAPTGPSSDEATVHITDDWNFALMMPTRPGEHIEDGVSDALAFCTPTSGDPNCQQFMPDGFITAADVARSDDGKFIQVTGCMDVTKSYFDPSDVGGQMDIHHPSGAMCTFGGRGASFIELIEPKSNRFCLRCCSDEDDPVNCNSKHGKDGCPAVISGTYSFPELGISCE